MRGNPKWPGKLEDKGKIPQGRHPIDFRRGDTEYFKKRGIEWKGLRATHRDHETW
jgi:hypothetical protein